MLPLNKLPKHRHRMEPMTWRQAVLGAAFLIATVVLLYLANKIG